MNGTILEVDHLQIYFKTSKGIVNVTNDVSFEIFRGETFCIVGESGCGKSVVALSIPRLLPDNAVVSGSICFDGREILQMPERDFHKLHGSSISSIFEQPMSCLNPVMRVGDQIAEAFTENTGCPAKEARDRAREMMREVKLPGDRYDSYPFELSGGMQQRVMIAMALACGSRLLIADEPTTSLDVTVQYQILELLQELKEKKDLSMLVITHDMGVVSEIADRIGVMYAGSMMEIADRDLFFEEPLHPYVRELIQVVRDPCGYSIPGSVPNLMDLQPGCPFAPRCFMADELCRREMPASRDVRGRKERCHHV